MKNAVLMHMGNRLAERRQQFGMTQEQLAEAAEVSPQTISNAELGKRALRPENIIKICEVLHMSTDYLLTGCATGHDLQFLQEQLRDASLTPEEWEFIEGIVQRCIDFIRTKR